MGFVVASVVLLGVVFAIILVHLFISRLVLRQPDWGLGERIAALSASAFLLGTFWLAFGGLYVLIIDTQTPPLPDPWRGVLVFLASPPSYVFIQTRGINFFQCFYNGSGTCDPFQFVGPAILTFIILILISAFVAFRQRRMISG